MRYPIARLAFYSVVFLVVLTACGWALAQAPASTRPAERIVTRQLFDKIIWDGGPIVWFQLAVSVVGFGFAIERLINLRRSAILPAGLVEQADALWRGGRFEELEAACRARPSTLGNVIGAIAQHRNDSPADVAAIAGEIASPELKLHLQKAYPIVIVATLEPMLGLFGTVWGMMGAFDTVAAAGEVTNPSVLAKDIGVALITTAVGLAVAIPMLALYHAFKSRTHTLAIELERTAAHLIKDWLRKS
jgi:biopolymer transport protein ExbB